MHSKLGSVATGVAVDRTSRRPGALSLVMPSVIEDLDGLLVTFAEDAVNEPAGLRDPTRPPALQ
jgi:hypothetical protein